MGSPVSPILLSKGSLTALRQSLGGFFLARKGSNTFGCLQSGELSSLDEYFNEEDPLDYTEKLNDVVLPGDLYGEEQTPVPLNDSACFEWSRYESCHDLREKGSIPLLPAP